MRPIHHAQFRIATKCPLPDFRNRITHIHIGQLPLHVIIRKSIIPDGFYIIQKQNDTHARANRRHMHVYRFRIRQAQHLDAIQEISVPALIQRQQGLITHRYPCPVAMVKIPLILHGLQMFRQKQRTQFIAAGKYTQIQLG